MSLRMRRGGGAGGGVTEQYGPSMGRQAVIDNALPTTVATPGSGITFATMSALQTAINANAANSVFIATASSYTMSGAFTWTANKHPRIYFPGPPGTRTITGSGGFFEGNQGGCEIRGGTFLGVGSGTTRVAVFGRNDFTVEDIECDGCYEGVSYDGATFGPGTVVYRRIYSHDSLFLGIGCSANSANRLNGWVMEKCTIADNNASSFSPDVTAAGLKCLQVTNATIRQNYCTGNYGFGLWADSVGSVTWEDNVCEDNLRAGVFCELAEGGSVIQRNYLKDNGLGDAIWPQSPLNDGQIQISSSDANLGSGVRGQCTRNVIDGADRALMLSQHNVHRRVTRNWDSTYNQFWIRDTGAIFGDGTGGGRVGGIDAWNTSPPTPIPLWTAGNTFENNDYHIFDLTNGVHRWTGGANGVEKTWVEWQSYGHDQFSTRVII